MDVLKAEIARKRKLLESKSLIDSNKKFFKREEMNHKWDEDYHRKQAEKHGHKSAVGSADSTAADGDASAGGGHSAETSGSSGLSAAVEQRILPRKEVVKRLRERNEPIILFAETETEAFLRLRKLELLEPEASDQGFRNDFQTAMESVDAAYLEEIVKVGADKSKKDGANDVKVVEMNTTIEEILQLAQHLGRRRDEGRDCDVIQTFLKFLLELWGKKLNARPEEVKRTAKGLRINCSDQTMDSEDNKDNIIGDEVVDEVSEVVDNDLIENIDHIIADSNENTNNTTTDAVADEDECMDVTTAAETTAADTNGGGDDNAVDGAEDATNDNTNAGDAEASGADGSTVDGSGVDGNAGADGDNDGNDVMDDNACDGGSTGGQMDDNELRAAGLKTSLMLSEDKIQALTDKVETLESELKKVYQHLLQAMEEKKKMEIKCTTLEEQLDRLMGSAAERQQQQSGQKTPPHSSAKKMAMSAKQPNIKNRGGDRFGANQRPYERRLPADFGYGGYGGGGDLSRLYSMPVMAMPVMAGPSRSPYARMGGMGGSGAHMSGITGHDDVNELSLKFHLPPHVDAKAHQLYDRIYDNFESRSVCVQIGVRPSVAAMYLAARMADYKNLSYKKIHEALGFSRTDIQTCCQEVSDVLGLGVQVSYNSTELIQQFGQQLRLPAVIVRVAAHVAKTAMNKRLVSAFDPNIVGVAALFLVSQVSKVKRSLTQLAIVSHVPEDTIINMYRHLRPKASELFPHDFVFSTSLENLPQ
ncbi:unnamed protein product, partial [Medioppia subpectinata]